MIDPYTVVNDLLAAAQAAPDRIAAERSIAPVLADLRERMKAERIEADAPAMLRTWSPEAPSPGEGIDATAGRLSARLDEVALAKRFGDADAVQRVIELTVRELRQVALANVR